MTSEQEHDEAFAAISGVVDGEAINVLIANFHAELKTPAELAVWQAEVRQTINDVVAFAGGEGMCRGEQIQLVSGEFIRAIELLIPPSPPSPDQMDALRAVFAYAEPHSVDFCVRTVG